MTSSEHPILSKSHLLKRIFMQKFTNAYEPTAIWPHGDPFTGCSFLTLLCLSGGVYCIALCVHVLLWE